MGLLLQAKITLIGEMVWGQSITSNFGRLFTPLGEQNKWIGMKFGIKYTDSLLQCAKLGPDR